VARAPAHDPLSVFINGRLSGVLRKASTGAVTFQYSNDWLHWESAFPMSLSLPLRESTYTGNAVIAVFENLLPDNPTIRQLAAERVRADGTDAFSLLAAIGRDCVGAMQFLPQGLEPGEVGQIDARILKEEAIETLLKGLGRNPLGMEADDDLRLSLAGAQEKTALLRWKNRWRVPSGSTPTTHILKPAIGQAGNLDLSQSVENEHFCMQLLAALGMPTAATRIESFGDTQALVVERFDRLLTSDKRLLRLPQEDCCQALSILPTRKYETDGGPGLQALLELFRASDEPQIDQRALIKAAIVFWLLAATDGHAKNFSLFLHAKGRFSLTPLYDVMSLQPLFDSGQVRRNQMKMAMAYGDKRHYTVQQIKPRHIVETVTAAGVSPKVVSEIAIELHEISGRAIDETLNSLPSGFPEALAMSIVKGYRQRLKPLSTL